MAMASLSLIISHNSVRGRKPFHSLFIRIIFSIFTSTNNYYMYRYVNATRASASAQVASQKNTEIKESYAALAAQPAQRCMQRCRGGCVAAETAAPTIREGGR